MKTLALWLTILVGGLSLSPSSSSAAPSYSSAFDTRIKSCAAAYWPYGGGEGWLWLKAQLIAESNLRPDAVSSAGALGIAQFMRRTWREVAKELHYNAGLPTDPHLAICAAAYYMLKLSLYWMPGINAPTTARGQLELAQASYNAGPGNILKAQARCGDAWWWSEIIACLPDVTGRHAKETIGYVTRIGRIHEVLLLQIPEPGS